MSVKIICPFVNETDVKPLRAAMWNLPIHFEMDH